MRFQNSIRAVLLVALWGVVIGWTSSHAEAQERIRLVGSFDGIKARVVYEERAEPKRFKFNFQLENAKPGWLGMVFANQPGGTVRIGTFVVDELGRGKIDIDTHEGDFVPDLGIGEAVTVVLDGRWYRTKLSTR